MPMAAAALPWVGLGVSVLGTAASVLGGRGAAKDQKALQQQALAQQQKMLDFTEGAYNEEKGFINPIREDIRREYFTDTNNSPGFARAKAEIENGADQALRANDQGMEAMGMTGSSADNASRVSTLLKKASMLGDARLRGEISKADLGFKLLSTDKSIPLLNAMSGANQGVAGTYQSMAGQAGQEKAAWNQAAGNLAAAGVTAMLTNRAQPAAAPQVVPGQSTNSATSMSLDTIPAALPTSAQVPASIPTPQQVPDHQMLRAQEPVPVPVVDHPSGFMDRIPQQRQFNQWNSWGSGFSPVYG